MCVVDYEILFVSVKECLNVLYVEGVIMVEIKFGYGFDCENEIKLFEVVCLLGENYLVDVKIIFLGVYVLLFEYKGCSDEYIDLVCGEMFDCVVEVDLVDVVDVFCENVGFSNE